MRLDAETTAARLIPLLPQRDVSHVQPRSSLADARAVGQPSRGKSVMFYLIWMVVMLVAQRFAANPAAVAQGDKPSAPINSAASSQTPPQNSGRDDQGLGRGKSERTQRGGVEETAAADTYPH